MSKVGDIIAGNSAVIHSNGPGHLWRQRQACPICMNDETPAKEPPPPAVTEQIADIADDLEELTPLAIACYHESGRDADGLCLDCGK